MTVAPASDSTFIANLTASVSPAITVEFGLFLFAAITYPSIWSITSMTLSEGAPTAAMSPGSGTSTEPISVPLAAAALIASWKLKIPETIKAAYSPRLCPATISGLIRCSARSRSIAKSAVSMAGWVYSV